MLEHHGGTVEKFIGDAVMAVFGIPVVHEDDALRAVRAVTELRESLHRDSNDELRADFGMELRCAPAINTGEVVAGDPTEGQAFATGSAVATAQRLEAAAQPRRDPDRRQHVSPRARSGARRAVAPLQLKGKADPCGLAPARRALGRAAFARRLDAPMVGRDRELGRSARAFDDAVAERECR